MYPLGTHFDELMSNIRPPQERLDAARDLPPKVREYLTDSTTFVTSDPHTRLAGAYGQQLCAGDVEDVDILVLIPGEPELCNPAPKTVINDLKKSLDGLPAVLGHEGIAEIDVERARRSVHVFVEDWDFHFDFVPCIAPNGVKAPLWVPDRGWGKWVKSDPLGFIQLLDNLAAEHEIKVRHLARLLKHFRNVQMNTRQPKSYWLAALVVYHVKNTLDMTQSLSVLFHDLVEAIYHQYAHLVENDSDETPHIPDPMLGHDISWNWERSHFETFMRRLDDARYWARQALQASDRTVAIDYWQRVFGAEYFPSDVADAADKIAAAAYPGKAFVAGSGLILPNRPASGSVVPTRPTTFHGDDL